MSLFGALGVLSSSAQAELRLASVFGDHMVLQRDVPVPVWGWADPGSKVTVEFAALLATATAGPGGRWQTQLPAHPASATGRELVIRAGIETRCLSDVLVGDVWLLGGQSNMGWSVKDSAEAGAATARANYPWLRAFSQLPMEGAAAQPTQDVKGGRWQLCTPAAAGNFSAVGFYFAVALKPQLSEGVPVAIIHTAMGGTAIESWIDSASLETIPSGRIGTKFYRDAAADYQEKKSAWQAAKLTWQMQADSAMAASQPAPPMAPPLRKEPEGVKPHMLPSALFNGKVAPLQPYALRGVVWYQGESNAASADSAKRYGDLLSLLIERWRIGWSDPKLPFLVVQLPGYEAPGKFAAWAEMRAQQAAVVARTPQTSLVVTIDLGERDNIHPTHKQAVGERVALAARKLVYGEASLADQGPRFKSAIRAGDEIRLHLAHTGALSPTNAASPQGFEVAGADGHFGPVPARIEGGAIVITAPASGPVTLRYAWKNWPEQNLRDASGLPLAPFITAPL